MARATVMFEELVVAIEAVDATWALRVQLELPLAHVAGATVDPVAAATGRDLRLAAAAAPGILGACQFLWQGTDVYWDVTEPAQAVTIALQGSHYARLIVGVEDAIATAERINRALEAAFRSPQ